MWPAKASIPRESNILVTMFAQEGFI